MKHKFKVGIQLINIIPPNQFKKIPWKNGLGVTTELAISEGGSLSGFDWRLSIASVVENGPFSDFSGYLRNLVLIEGKGIALQHDQQHTDHLTSLLSVATFDGACKTIGTLKSGPIKDLNIMVNPDKYQVKVATYVEQQTVEIEPCDLYFVFCLSGTAELSTFEQDSMTEHYTLQSEHLLKMTSIKADKVTVSGQQMIIVCITDLNAA